MANRQDPDALIIGAGPAGLMAASQIADAGYKVVIADRMPSAGRKFLMAGKSGLNITKKEPDALFCAAYREAEQNLAPMLDVFGPDQVTAWAEQLGQEVFVGSTGRVFPKAMKASPLLRSWLAELAMQGAELLTRWTWVGWKENRVLFETPHGRVSVDPNVTVLALGGASWSRLGSDGKWASNLSQTVPFAPANMGVARTWSAHMADYLGKPLKGIAITAGSCVSRGEVVLSERGVEGGGIYALSPQIRAGLPLTLDLKPDLDIGALAQRLGRPKGKASLSTHLRKSAALSKQAIALAQELARPLPNDAYDLAKLLKSLPLHHEGPLPLDEAISVAGGLAWEAVDGNLMLLDRPGTFACGEMLDWEAPTGGYLITACLSTGAWAGKAATRWLGSKET